MKKLLLLFLLSVIYQQFALGQGAVVVVRSPEWYIQEQAKAAAEKADRITSIAQLSTVVSTGELSLQTLKDATKRLIEINRRVADYRHLEEALLEVSNAYANVRRVMGTLNDHSCFSPTEYREINESLMLLVSQTSYAVSTITIVVTDNFASMGNIQVNNNFTATLNFTDSVKLTIFGNNPLTSNGHFKYYDVFQTGRSCIIRGNDPAAPLTSINVKLANGNIWFGTIKYGDSTKVFYSFVEPEAKQPTTTPLTNAEAAAPAASPQESEARIKERM